MSGPDDATRLYVSLGRVIRMLRRSNPQSDIGHGSLSALASLVSTGPMRLGELAVTEGVSRPSMTRIVASLEALALVRRTADPDDGRAYQVEATDAGHDLVNAGREVRIGELRVRLNELPADERAALLAAIPVLESLTCVDPE